MEKKNNIIKEEKEKEKNPQNNIQNEKEIKEIKNSENEIKIKKPIISKEEYDNAIKKRNLMAKNSKYRPIKLLFGKHKKPLNLSNSVSVTNPTINNTNIQINNYTTYLTTVESIAEEKYMKDGKTLIVENSPCYSIKKLNNKFQNEHLNKIMIIYIKKINETEDIYNFTNQYLSFIIKLFEDLSKAYITSLSNKFANNIKPNLIYFQRLVPILKGFSEELKIFENNNVIDNINNPDSNLINSAKTINIAKADNFNTISNNLQNIILNNHLYIQLGTIESKFNEILIKMEQYINKLNKRRNKYNVTYKKEIEPLFSGIKQRLNNEYLFYEYLTNCRDFLYIEYYIIFHSNKIFNKISQFLINMDILFKSTYNLFCDYLELLNNLIKSFCSDNKNILNFDSFLPKELIISLNSILNTNNIKRMIRKRFEFNRVIEKSIDNKLINDINHSLLNYKELLEHYNYINNEEIEEIINFNLIKYKSSEDFIQFLMRLIPEKFSFKFNDMIQLKLDIKKNLGFFSGWKNSLLIITYQGHILLFDQEKKGEQKKKEEINFNINKRTSRKEIINSIIEEDNKQIEPKKKEKTDNNEIYEVIANNKLTDVYLKNKFGIMKVPSNSSKTLLQFYENYLNVRQYRQILVDLINVDNMNILINNISKNKFV